MSVRDRARPGGAAGGRGAALPDQLPRLPLLREGRARDQRRRVRRADAPPPRHRGALPGADHAGLADPARRRRARVGGVRRRRAPRAAALAGQRLQLRRAAGLAQPRRRPGRASSDFRYGLRAEDRRPRRGAGLRGRALRPGRHPRRRLPRREHHREPPTIRSIPMQLRGHGLPRALRGARRGLHAEGRLRAAEQRAGRPRRAAVRQPPQRRRRRRPPARPAQSRPRAGSTSGSTSSAGRKAAPARARTGRRSTGWAAGLPHQPRDRAASRSLERRPGASTRSGRSAATSWSTRSTAWS